METPKFEKKPDVKEGLEEEKKHLVLEVFEKMKAGVENAFIIALETSLRGGITIKEIKEILEEERERREDDRERSERKGF